MAKLRVFVLNGPNMNLLGTREPGVYGNMPYEQLVEQISFWASELDIELGYAQTNSEGGLIDYIHASYGQFDLVVLNPGAFTHTSYALRDAIVGVGLPVVEVHLSNIFAREEWRAKSVISSVCVGTISGLGVYGYRLALEAGKHFLSSSSTEPSVSAPAAVPSVSLQSSPRPSISAPVHHAAPQSLSLASEPPRAAQSNNSTPTIVSVPVENVDQGDLANLFMPTHKFEVANQGGNLGGEVGINEIQGFANEGEVSVFIGNPETETDDDEELSPEDREKLKAWMGDDSYEEPSPEDYRLGGGISRVSESLPMPPSPPSSSSYSGSDLSDVSLSGQGNSKNLASAGQSQSGVTKRLSIPIKVKK
ncbi:MAG: type II 3-dehydroquinate dehydratase [Candidatus Bruticola sp.]